MVDENPVLYREEAEIAVLTLNRPKALNALDIPTLESLSALLDQICAAECVKAVIITGTGTAFSAGADIRYLHRATPLQVREFARLAVSVNNKIENLGKIVAAAINGYALGGGLELAEGCALRVAASAAKMGHPEVNIGAIAGFGGTTRLPRLVGKASATELLLRGRLLGADEALEIGLIHKVTPSENLLDEARAFLRDIVGFSPIAVKLTWEAIHRGLDLTLEESAVLGADMFGLVASSEDFRIGTKAFLEKTR
ncbi:MAG TPA: enoyl-CoA hydratase-related protein [Candidatus Angelobacter sp.]|nr:enoyl-CoA hydratase-related protein [Candidatus Angelobacter sp.]